MKRTSHSLKGRLLAVAAAGTFFLSGVAGAAAGALGPVAPLQGAALKGQGATTEVQYRGDRNWRSGPGWRGKPGWRGNPGWRGPGYRGGPYVYGPGYRNCGWGGCNNNGAAVAAGVIGGLALGAAAAAAANSSSAPVRSSNDWIAYCSSKYRSFDPSTGTYLGYDGKRHPCS